MSKQKKQAHEIIMRDLMISLEQMSRAQRDIKRGEDARRDLEWSRCNFYTLLHVLGEMIIPENARPWISEELAKFADRATDDWVHNEIRIVLRKI